MNFCLTEASKQTLSAWMAEMNTHYAELENANVVFFLVPSEQGQLEIEAITKAMLDDPDFDVRSSLRQPGFFSVSPLERVAPMLIEHLPLLTKHYVDCSGLVVRFLLKDTILSTVTLEVEKYTE